VILLGRIVDDSGFPRTPDRLLKFCGTHGFPEDTWAQLRRAFINNYMATCQQPGNKYDLKKVRDYL
jgi:hypothetical protein